MKFEWHHNTEPLVLISTHPLFFSPLNNNVNKKKLKQESLEGQAWVAGMRCRVRIKVRGLVISHFIPGIQGSLIVNKEQLYWHLWRGAGFPWTPTLPTPESRQHGRLQQWRLMPILKRSQFMKGRDIKELINGFHRPGTQPPDWSYRWYCYWRSADTLQVSGQDTHLSSKQAIL